MVSWPHHEAGTRELAEDQPVKVVGSLTLHGGYLDFQTLCRRVLTSSTRYLVIDLDRTVHFKRNVGELLGFELCAYLAYGPEHYHRLSAHADRNRFMFDWNRPGATLRYLLFGARLWAYPGLFYFLFGKMGLRFPATRRWVYRCFGSEALESIQRIPRTALMHHLAGLPLSTSHELATTLLQRLEPDQAILREDIDWLRATYPNLKIIISSASPRPAVEASGEMLGIDEVIYSAVEEREGYLSSPSHLKRMFMLFRQPHRISPPSHREHNAGARKVAHLIARYPDFCDSETETVGITDTGYGEDHSWAHYFTKVVDMNSSAPFSPVIPGTSPLQEIHSAHVLTLEERTRRAQGVTPWLASGRRERPEVGERRFSAEELAGLLAPHSTSVERLVRQWRRLEAEANQVTGSVQRKLALLVTEIEETVHRFNQAEKNKRKQVLGGLRRLLKEQHALERRYVQLTEPISSLTCQMRTELERARLKLETVAGHTEFPSDAERNGGRESASHRPS